jgi:plasmid stabilization system protein ParE
MTFEVRWSATAREDIKRLHDFLLERAQTLDDLDAADHAIAAIEHAAVHQLGRTPFIFRRAGTSKTTRELIIPFGSTGYVVRYDVRGRSSVIVLAVRHQREEDYL